MSKRLHTKSKIIFSDPIVFKVDMPEDITADAASAAYRKFTRSLYKLMGGTWGYTELQFDSVNGAVAPSLRPGVGVIGAFQGIFAASNFRWVRAGYVCFQDRLDAMQFKLSCLYPNAEVKMWPSAARFTIVEYVEDGSARFQQ